LRIKVSELADRQIQDAERWWRQNREKAPDAVREELTRIGALIASQPQLGARATNVKLQGVRRIHLERIHYHLYYRVVGSPSQQYIEILAFWGVRRGSGPPI
jgi:plasmid stabilization system protein ParE